MKETIKKATVTNKSYDYNDILRYAIENDIIPLDTMLNDIETMERKKLLALHPYAITETVDKKTGKTLYYTYLPNEKKGKRTYKRRQTRKELEDLLVAFYKDVCQTQRKKKL